MMASVAWGAMLVSSGAHAQYYKADGSQTSNLEAAAASWRALPAFAANPALKALNAEYAYAYGYRGTGAQLGFVDTSIYLAHPGFAGNHIVPLITRGVYSVDGTLPGQHAGKPFVLDPTDLTLNIYEGDEHATNMTGFAVGSGSGGYPQGVAPGATVYLARSIGQNFPTTLKEFDDNVFIAAYQALTASGVRAITSMWQVGRPVYTREDMMHMYNEAPNSGLLGAMAEAAKKGVLMIMPNGNYAGLPGIGSSLPYFRPELERNWLAVASTSDGKTLSVYSNVCSSYAKWWCVTSTAFGNSISYEVTHSPAGPHISPTPFVTDGWGGTSEASADTLGAVGVLLQRYPYLASGEIRDILLSTARPLDGTGVSDNSGFGLIDLKEAMNGPKQLLGNFNASLPRGVIDTWSNAIGETALIQRKREERAELAALQATTREAFRANVLANAAAAPALLDDLLAKIIAVDIPGATAALAAARANPVAQLFLAALLSRDPNDVQHIDEEEVRKALIAALPNSSGPITDEALKKAIAAFIDNRDLRLKYLSSKTDADYVGKFTKSGGGTLVLTGASTYTGPTEVAGGQLAVNGSIVSHVTIDTGAVLAGIGKVGTTTVSTGGVLAPGFFGQGTLTINGTLSFASGSYLFVSATPRGMTKVSVTGTAALNGTVLAMPSGITSLPKAQTILTAAGFNKTRFTGLGTPVGMYGELGYTDTSVNLSLHAGLGRVAGLGANQVTIGSAIDASLNGGATISPAFLALLTTATAQGLQANLSSVSGEAQAATPMAFSQGMGMVLNTMIDPNSGNRSTPLTPPSATPPPGMSNLGVPQNTPAESGGVRQAVPRYTMWGAGFGGASSVSGATSTGTHAANAHVYGSAAGFDYRLSPNTTAGLSLGGGTVSWGLSDGLGGGSADMLHAGLYGITRSGPTYLSGALALGWMGGTSQRTVSVFGPDRLKSDTSAEALGMRLESGIRVPVSQGLLPSSAVTPYAALQMQRVTVGSASEQTVAGGGASPFALSYGSQLRTFTRTELGARFASRLRLPDGTGVTLQARAAWAHDFDTESSVNAAFQSLPVAFTVAAARPAADGALLSAGSEMQLTHSISLGTNIDGEFSATTQIYAGTLNLRVQW